MSDDATVFIRKTMRARTYHTRADCPYLPTDPASYREVAVNAVEPHYAECQVCRRGPNRGDYAPPETHDTLDGLDPDDVPPGGSADG